MLVIEYKGDAYATNDDSKEKNLIGELWAKHGGGKTRKVLLLSNNTYCVIWMCLTLCMQKITHDYLGKC